MRVPIIILSVFLAILLLGEIIARRLKNRRPSVAQLAGTATALTYDKLGKKGDFGNQMFQIAATFAAAKRYGASFFLSGSQQPVYKVFDLEGLIEPRSGARRQLHEFGTYDPIIPGVGLNNVRGYRQSYKYFHEYRDQVRSLFTVRQQLVDAVRSRLPRHYVAIHVRRGDYLKVPLYAVCGTGYYRAAIESCATAKLPVIVCTDDRKWVAESKELGGYGLSPPVEGVPSYITDFITLIFADYCVIANSTFSWWAAYLGNAKAVFLPSQWYNEKDWRVRGLRLSHPTDFCVPGWIRLHNDSGEVVHERGGSDSGLATVKLILGLTT